VSQRLRAAYPDAKCALVFSNPLELVIATILSAQCTDQRVNQVTPALFRKYPSAAAFAMAPQEELEEAIRSTGFFRNKAKSILGCCRKIVDEFDGEVPPRMEAMVTLPGVGRKTANVVLGTAFGIATGVVVDTHVARLSRRMGLTRHTQPEKIESDLIKALPRREWIDFGHRMILHGRKVCAARRPNCAECILLPLCPQVGVKSR
jgi:endonuclease-3